MAQEIVRHDMRIVRDGLWTNALSYPEEGIFEGIGYTNSGAWTEFTFYYILVNDKNMILKSVDDFFEPPMAEQLN